MSAPAVHKGGRAKRFARRALRWGGASLVVLGVGAGTLALWLDSGFGHAWLTEMLNRDIDQPGADITVSGISGSIFTQFTLEGLTVSDAGGVWLSAPAVSVDWAPFSLLSGDLRVHRVGANDAVLARLPEIPPSDKESKPLPFTLHLWQADIGLRYGQADGGQYRILATGFALDKAGITGVLVAENSQQSDRLQAQLAWRRAQASLAVDVQIQAAEQGLLGGLMGLTGLGALTADIKGHGQLAAWQGDISMKVGDVLTVSGVVAGSGQGLSLAADIDQALPLPDAAQSLVASKAKVSSELLLAGIVPEQLSLHINSTKADVTAVLPIGPDNRVTGGTLTALVPAYQVAAGSQVLMLDQAQMEGSFDLDWPRFELRYRLQAGDIQRGTVRAKDVIMAGTLAIDQYQVGGEVQTLQVAQLTAGAGNKWHTDIQALTGNWNIRRTDNAWRFDIANGRTGLGRLGSARATGGANGNFELALDANITHAGISRLVPALLSAGNADVRLQMRQGANDTGLVIDYALAGRALAWQQADLNALVGAVPTATGRLFLRDNGTLDISALRAAGDGLSVAGEARLDADQTIRGRLSADIREDAALLHRSPVALPTGLQLEIRFDGPAAHPAVVLETSLASLEGYGLTLADTHIKADLTPMGDIWNGTLRVKGMSGMGPVILVSPLEVRQDAFTAKGIKLETPLMTAAGDIDWAAEGGLHMRGDAHLVPKETAAFRLSGTGVGHFDINSTPGGIKGQVKVTADELELSVPGEFPLHLKSLELDSELESNGALSYRAGMQVISARYGAQQINNLTVAGTSGDEGGFSVQADGYLGNDFEFTSTIRPSKTALQADATLRYGGAELTTRQAISVAWADGLEIDIPELLVAGGGIARAALKLKGQDVTFRAHLKDVPLKTANSFRMGLFRAGVAQADLQFDRTATTDHAVLKTELAGVQFFTSTLAGDEDLYHMTLAAELKDGLVTGNGDAYQAELSVGHVDAELPVERGGPRGYRITSGKPLSATLAWNGDVAPLWLIARQPDHYLEGQLAGGLLLQGDIDAPSFAGNLALEGGRYDYEPLGLVAHDLVFDIEGDNKAVVLKSLSATDGNGGTLDGNGRFELVAELAFPGVIRADFKNFRMARLDTANGTASARLTYERALAGHKVMGAITTGTLNFTLPRELPQSVVDIEVTEINGREGPTPASLIVLGPKRQQTGLDVTVTVPGQLFVRGRGLESEWTGKLKIGGTSATPLIYGVMDLKNGSFLLGGKRFTIDQGRLSFHGGKRIDPDLELSASYQTTGLQADLRILGPVSAPKFSLSSTPALAEDEILSRILFGRTVADLTPFQIAELAVALNSLRGSTAFDVVGKLRRQLGLDSLSIAAGDDDVGGALLTGGKYLRDNIYLEVETSTATSEAAARLKVNITKNLLAESEVGPRLGSSLKLKWFWEY